MLGLISDTETVIKFAEFAGLAEAAKLRDDDSALISLAARGRADLVRLLRSEGRENSDS